MTGLFLGFWEFLEIQFNLAVASMIPADQVFLLLWSGMLGIICILPIASSLVDGRSGRFNPAVLSSILYRGFHVVPNGSLVLLFSFGLFSFVGLDGALRTMMPA